MSPTSLKYPGNWREISKETIARAGFQCEVCGVKGGQVICRLRANPFQYRYLGYAESEVYAAEGWHDQTYHKPVMVRLSVHHRGVKKANGRPGDPHDKMDCRPENLLVVCARCHFEEERKIMKTERAQRRVIEQRKGQLSFLDDE